MMTCTRWAFASVVLLALSSAAAAQTRLLRFPDLHGDQVVFCHGGDLWLAGTDGRNVRRLTTHPGLELFPRFSPDGKWIAFTGQIDGDEQVYVMPRDGGAPRQLTFYPALGPLPSRWGYDHQVLGWSPDSTRVLFRSFRQGWTMGRCSAFTVALAGGLPQALPMPQAGATCFSPDGRKVLYSPLFRDFRTWKRYQGGWQQDLYTFDLDTQAVERITDHPRTDRDPMWTAQGVFFVSDRTDTLNLYRYDPQTRRTEQLTDSDQWDVRWPAAAPDGRIVYELGGELHVFDPQARTTTRLSIEVPSDDLVRRPSYISAADRITGFAVAPGGKRAAFAARGDIFTAPVENGPTRNLTHSPGAYDREPSWSPDGRRIAFISDLSGEEQIYVVDQDGRDEPRALTHDQHVRLLGPTWSPDGSQLAFGDKDGRLQIVDADSGALTAVAKEDRGTLSDYDWSPCSAHIAFSLSEDSGARSIWIWSKADGQTHRVTGPLTDESSPRWGRAGERLFFLGTRSFAPRIDGLEWNYQIDRATDVFVLALRKDLPPLFPPRSDEVETAAKPTEAEAKKDDEKPAAGKAEAPQPTRIDFDGLAARVEAVPIEADNYAGLVVLDKQLLLTRRGAFFYGRGSDREPELLAFDLAERKLDNRATGIGGLALSADRKSMLAQFQGGYWIAATGADGWSKRKRVATDGLRLDRVPADEWAEIFDDVWRRYRDYFYAPNMHGHDWEALREQYRALLPHVAHRSDLNYVIGEMIGELNVGHAYISGGDQEQPERPRVALPGARFALDRDAGRYRIKDILGGDNTTEQYRSPLTEVGVDARVGDYVLAIDGTELRADDNPYRLLRHKGPYPVRLTLNDKPTADGARQTSFRPLTSERNLDYWGWVAHNRARVDELSGGRVGYLHIPDMGAQGIQEFIRWFYPQIRKQGLVIDVRYNGGGNISQMLIERLRRELLMMTFGRTTGAGTYPRVVFAGHLVCLLNENSASDGDIFPAMFKRAGLGPLVGKRSWGGIVGITDRGPLMDGGTVNVPEFANTEPTGEWTIEGYGVDPDVEVDNDPRAELEGRDPQLEKGVQLVLEAIARQPRPLPERPADPVRR